MRSVVLMTGFLVMFGMVLAIGAPSSVAAQELAGTDSIELQVVAEGLSVAEWDEVTAIASDLDAGERRGTPRQRELLKRVMLAVHKACPCEGPETGVAWKNHGEFVACVTDKVNELKDKGLPDEAAAKIIERAAQSEIGKPGHVCPTPGERPTPRERERMKRVVLAVHKACPCEGPEAGVAWKNHGEFVACVTDKVNELKDKGLPEEAAARIIERAAQSEIGKPGHVCPVPPERPDRPEPGEPREPRQRGERP